MIEKWLFRVRAEYEARIGRRVSDKVFASYLGIDRSWFTKLKNGMKNPGRETVDQIYEATGDITIYDATGFERPHPTQDAVRRELADLPADVTKEKTDELIRQVREWKARYGYQTLKPPEDAPER